MPACLLSEMEVNHQASVAALENELLAATQRRLRFLSVAFVAGRFRVIAICPSCHVRQLAEQAAITQVPSDQLELYVHVSPPGKLP